MKAAVRAHPCCGKRHHDNKEKYRNLYPEKRAIGALDMVKLLMVVVILLYQVYQLILFLDFMKLKFVRCFCALFDLSPAAIDRSNASIIRQIYRAFKPLLER